MLCSKGWGAIGSLKVEIGVTDLHFRKAGLEAEGHGNSMLGICVCLVYTEKRAFALMQFCLWLPRLSAFMLLSFAPWYILMNCAYCPFVDCTVLPGPGLHFQ